MIRITFKHDDDLPTSGTPTSFYYFYYTHSIGQIIWYVIGEVIGYIG